MSQPPLRPVRPSFTQKIANEPWVPLGCLLTAGILGFGLFSFGRGNSRWGQYAMRARVAAQGVTLIGAVGGMYWANWKDREVAKEDVAAAAAAQEQLLHGTTSSGLAAAADLKQ
eukprot:TRINITY_DN15444_c0_g1_i1.p1 TRINITY_DN15444_c0_g1~~TRINITY_DN15444_c0_g1_i1.p1  ORF type:complete len:114 (+),score=22.36 TRINITY_DN15444_c0_g1_i1:50-391(+)